MRKLLLLGAIAVGLLAPLAAQTVIQNQVSGNEVWSAAQGPGGASQWLSIDTVSGRTEIATGTITGAESVPAILSDGGNLILTGQPSTAALTAPASPIPNGAIVGVCNGTASAFATAVVTYTAAANQTVVNGAIPAALAAGACARYQWNLANTTWYRIQ